MTITWLDVTQFYAVLFGFMGLWDNVKKNLSGYYCWLISNAFWIIYGIMTLQWSIVAMFSAYTVFTVYGIKKWSGDEE